MTRSHLIDNLISDTSYSPLACNFIISSIIFVHTFISKIFVKKYLRFGGEPKPLVQKICKSGLISSDRYKGELFNPTININANIK